MASIREVFVNTKEKRFRMPWRLSGHLVVFAILAVLGSLLTGFLSVLLVFGEGMDPATMGVEAISEFVVNSPVARAINTVAILAAMLGATWAAARWLDRRPIADFGLKIDGAWWRDLAFGLFLGALLMGLIFAVEYALGWVTLTGSFQGVGDYSFAEGFLGALIAFFCVGIYEEVLSRGYHMSNFAQGLSKIMGPQFGLIGGWLIASLIFGLLHAGNPNATWISTNNIAIAGLFLGLGYLLNGRLALPIGLHITWNLFQGNVFGFPVSGSDAGATVIAIEQGGPVLWTGGLFGPEAGLIGLAAMLLGIGLTLLYVRLTEGKIALHLPITEPPALPAESAGEAEASAAQN